MEDVVIVGAGITGLSTAYWLKKAGIKFKLIESKGEVGGNIKTERNLDFIFDTGPNSGLETKPLIKQLVDELKLNGEFVYANPLANKRYILKDGTLHQLPMSPPLFFTTKLFSWKGKLRVMIEPFVGRSKDGYYQSLGEFVRRRLGEEFLDYVINPFVSGVFAGDPDDLSVKSAFPKLYRLEEVYGGLFKGMIKGAKERKKRAEKSKQEAKIFSFVNGMSVLPNSLSKLLNEELFLNSTVTEIVKSDDIYQVYFKNDSGLQKIETKTILLTIPAHSTAELIRKLDPELFNHLSTIYYPPVLVINVIYDGSKIFQELDGFGFLIPAKEKKTFLGAIWNSSIFPNRGDEKFASFTIFVGGARKENLFENGVENLIPKVLSEFEEIMKIEGEAESIKYRFWEKAIPQYNLGYIEKEFAMEKFEKNNLGIFLGGNYRGGISVGDCIKNSKIHSERILTFIHSGKYIEYQRELN